MGADRDDIVIVAEGSTGCPPATRLYCRSRDRTSLHLPGDPRNRAADLRDDEEQQ